MENISFDFEKVVCEHVRAHLSSRAHAAKQRVQKSSSLKAKRDFIKKNFAEAVCSRECILFTCLLYKRPRRDLIVRPAQNDCGGRTRTTS